MLASPCWGLDPLMGQLLGQRGPCRMWSRVKIEELDHDNTRRRSYSSEVRKLNAMILVVGSQSGGEGAGWMERMVGLGWCRAGGIALGPRCSLLMRKRNQIGTCWLLRPPVSSGTWWFNANWHLVGALTLQMAWVQMDLMGWILTWSIFEWVEMDSLCRAGL